MSTTVEVKDPSMVEIPSDMIQLGFTADGMPIAEPTDKAIAEGKEEPKPPTLAELEQMRRERDEATQRLTTEAEAKTKAEAEAKQAREDAEAVTGKLGKTENLLHDRTIQGAAAHWRSVHSEHQQITGAIAQTEALAASYEKELATASEAGDHVRVASTQRAIARAEAQLAQLEAGKSASAQEVERAERLYREVNAAPPVEKEEPKPKTEPEVKKADAEPAKVSPDQWIDNVRSITSDDAAKWLKDHKDFVTDTAKNQKLTSFAQYYASKHGQAALKSDTFVAALNKEFFPEDETMTEETNPAPKVQTEAKPKARATPAAPVSRGGDVFSSTNLKAARIFVPPDVAAFCKSANLNPESYVLSVREEILRGEKPKEWLDPGFDRGIR